jgi:hypothetical protein
VIGNFGGLRTVQFAHSVINCGTRKAQISSIVGIVGWERGRAESSMFREIYEEKPTNALTITYVVYTAADFTICKHYC